MENMEITKDGALVSSTGFELVSSIVGTGAPKNLLNYEKDDTSRYLLITHGTNHYSITPSSSTWSTTNLGSYGTEANYVGGVVYLGTSTTRRAILGNDIVANTTKKADLSAAMANLAGAPPDGYIMATFMGRLFIADGVTLYYSAVEDEDNFAGGGTIKFNDIITGLKVSGDRLTVFTRTYHQGVIFQYSDAASLSVPLKEPNERAFGCLAPKSVQQVYSDIFYWSDDGVMKLGAEVNFSEGTPRPQSLSRLIDPSLDSTNRSYRIGACAEFYQRQYYLGVPFGTDNFNSKTFVYNLQWNAWTLRTGFYPSSLALFRNSNYKQELYFTNFFAPELYKFNSEYSYNGFGYQKKWKSKKFTHGDHNTIKVWEWIDITGSMDSSTEITVTIQVDNTKKKYNIDNTMLEVNSFGEYIGDNFLGNALLGGSEPSESRFKRFRCRIPFNSTIKEGYEMQITLENSEDQQPYKIDFIGIKYDYRPQTMIPSTFVNNQTIAS
jgi:hypothetical protein